MHISVGQLSLIDLVSALERKEIIINKDYQREAGVWPDSARTYFIDTILEGYPFPKIYLYQVFNEKTKRPIQEIVDGQQRVTTIVDFIENKLKLSSASKKYAGMKYDDLSIEKQQEFQAYFIETSIIRTATRSELLEMFRRINAYTAPLSPAEKRHSTYQGEFKWFIVEIADESSYIFEKFNILTAKQLSRMGDAEFIADMMVALEKGVVAKTAKNIDDLYKKYDLAFEEVTSYKSILNDFFKFLNGPLAELSDTYIMKSYVIHSLFSAFALVKYGLPNSNQFAINPNHNIQFNIANIQTKLRELAYAHEQQEEDGKYGDYVKVCLSITTKLPQRTTRVKILANVLMN